MSSRHQPNHPLPSQHNGAGASGRRSEREMTLGATARRRRRVRGPPSGDSSVIIFVQHVMCVTMCTCPVSARQSRHNGGPQIERRQAGPGGWGDEREGEEFACASMSTILMQLRSCCVYVALCGRIRLAHLGGAGASHGNVCSTRKSEALSSALPSPYVPCADALLGSDVAIQRATLHGTRAVSKGPALCADMSTWVKHM